MACQSQWIIPCSVPRQRLSCMSDNDRPGWASVSRLRARGYCTSQACYLLIMEQYPKPLGQNLRQKHSVKTRQPLSFSKSHYVFEVGNDFSRMSLYLFFFVCAFLGHFLFIMKRQHIKHLQSCQHSKKKLGSLCAKGQ